MHYFENIQCVTKSMSAGGMLALTTWIQCIPSFVSVKINFHVRVFFSLFIIVLLFIVLDFIYIGNLFSIFYNANLP